MSEGRTAGGAAQRVGSGTTRLVRAWKALPPESRLAAYASGGLILTLFLPWYQVTLIAPAKAAKLQSSSATITGWGAFSFVEAAVLLVAVAVLVLLFQRAEGRAFHLPGGDGGVITAAGLWTCVLIIWRMFDKQGATTNGPSATTSGIEWGIFIALGAAACLAYSGSRIRGAHRPEPPLPGEADSPPGSNGAADRAAPPRPRRRARPPRPVAAERPPVRRRSASRAAPRDDLAPAPQPPADRPRRRVPAAELFERVVPDDPPTMPFGRSKPADATLPMRSASPPPEPADEQLTIPLGTDETARLGTEETVRLGTDETVRLDGSDDTLPLDRN